MNTFLPYASFVKSAECLDRQRLGKQRIECLQLIKALKDSKYGWQSHPCTIMWRGHDNALVAYGLAICNEWIKRGYSDSVYWQLLDFKTTFEEPTEYTVQLPKWIGNEAFHASHRSNLLRKDYKWYKAYRWTELPILPYVWPTP